jgi:hypothetical protein
MAAAVPPKVTDVVPVKPVPVITTVVPPLVGPVSTSSEVITGGATYVNSAAEVAVPPEVVTVIEPDPVPAALTAVI